MSETQGEKTREEVQTLVAVVERQKDASRAMQLPISSLSRRRGVQRGTGGPRWQIQRDGRWPGADGSQSQAPASHEPFLSHRYILQIIFGLV